MPRYSTSTSSGSLHSSHAQAAPLPYLAGRTVGEIGHPQTIWPVGLEVPVHQIARTGSGAVRDRGAAWFVRFLLMAPFSQEM